MSYIVLTLPSWATNAFDQEFMVAVVFAVKARATEYMQMILTGFLKTTYNSERFGEECKDRTRLVSY